MGNIAVFSEVIGGGGLLVAGLAMIITKKAIGVKRERFTEESLKKYATVMGIFTIILGVSFVMIFEGMSGLLFGVVNTKLTVLGDVTMITFITIWMLCSNHLLVQKKTPEARKIANNKAKRKKRR